MTLLNSIILAALPLLCAAGRSEYEYVSCGSLIKLMNSRHQVRLHSHDVKYGSGSGQQSVTGMPDMDDHNSHWTIRPALRETCKRGEPLKCGTTIRLQHSATGTFLHSHHFPSPLSKNQEVSCFGGEGKSDTGDNWRVDCDTELWERGDDVRLFHVDTRKYLATTGHRYGRPINGQNEICAMSSATSETAWKTAEGVYIKPSED